MEYGCAGIFAEDGLNLFVVIYKLFDFPLYSVQKRRI